MNLSDSLCAFMFWGNSYISLYYLEVGEEELSMVLNLMFPFRTLNVDNFYQQMDGNNRSNVPTLTMVKRVLYGTLKNYKLVNASVSVSAMFFGNV